MLFFANLSACFFIHIKYYISIFYLKINFDSSYILCQRIIAGQMSLTFNECHWHLVQMSMTFRKCHWQEKSLSMTLFFMSMTCVINVNDILYKCHWQEISCHWHEKKCHWHENKCHWHENKCHWHKNKCHWQLKNIYRRNLETLIYEKLLRNYVK